LQIHKPEVCYATQGFQINQMTKINVDLGIGKVPAMHLVATQGQRVEPITYWIRIGDKLARGWFEQNIARVSYGLKGQIPDGVLVRVSNISGNEKDSYELQTAFLTSMLKGMHAEDRSLLVGTLSDQ
jgi:EpsI family protein